SPLVRAAESASILVAALTQQGFGVTNGQVRNDARLREVSFGACEGMTREEIDVAFPAFWADHEAGNVDAFPGGEPRAEFAARIAAAVTELAAQPWQGDALLVAHRGTVRHAIVTLLADPDPPRAAYAVGLASVSVLRETVAGWQLDLLGMTGG